MANIRFRSRSGTNASQGIRRANKRVSKSTFDATIKNLTTAAIFLEGEEKRAISNYPIVDTGRFLNSISHDIKVEQRIQKVVAKVGSTIKEPMYPTYLEFGTSKMAARPTMRPTWSKNLNKIKKIIKDGVRRGIANGTR